MVQRFRPSAHAPRGHGSPTGWGSVSSSEGSFRFAPHPGPQFSCRTGFPPAPHQRIRIMGLPKGPEGQGLPEVRTSVPDTLGLLEREGRARGGGQGPAWEAAGTLCGLLRRVCPKAGPGYPGGTADWSPGVQGRSVLLGANLKVPGSSGFRGEQPDPCPDATSHITRSPGVPVSGCLEAPHVASQTGSPRPRLLRSGVSAVTRRSVGLSWPRLCGGR